ncbi:MAG: O-antigen ligase family protein [Alphaproteobacteria bacterium]|nr:O-antigen ligase family protein [Alphaproteobacteria bacterium]
MARLIFWALMALVALAPLPFASNRPWSWSLLSLLVGLLLVLWAFALIFDRAAWTGDVRRTMMQVTWRRFWLGALFFAAMVGWLVAQATPGIFPEWHNPVWTEAADILGIPVTSAISLNPQQSASALMLIIVYGGVFWLAMQYGRREEWAFKALWTVCFAGACYAFYGLLVHLGHYDMILWYKKWAYHSSLTSTFVNRNNYATYAGLTLLVSLVLTMREMQRTAPAGIFSRYGILEFLDNMSFKLIFLIVSTVMIATALLLTQSRGGFISSLVGVFALFVAMAMNQRKRKRAIISSFLVMAVAGYVLISVSGGGTLTRLAGTGAGDIGGTRQKIFAIAKEAAIDAPSTGTGLGTFQDIFHQYRGTDWYVWTPAFDRAHNTYLELIIEMGLVPTLALILLFVGLTVLCLRGVIKRRRHAMYPCIAVAATALVGTHALIDFSIQIPAVAVTYFLLLGIGYSQSWGSGDRRSS